MDNCREELTSLLVEAAEMEHGILCQYLFAAFSMKKHPREGGVTWVQLEKVRKWTTAIYLVARQEMEHLGLVCNLLTAIGEAPHLRRPNFPIQSRFYPIDIRFELEPFSKEVLKRFIAFERPEEYSIESLGDPDPLTMIPIRELLETIDFYFMKHKEQSGETIGELYEKIKELLRNVDEKTTFIGPPSAQVTNKNFLPPQYDIPTPRVWHNIAMEPIVDKESAEKAIDRIIEEGEGAPGHQENSHFNVFLNVYKELEAELEADPTFSPARPVVKNPWTRRPWDIPFLEDEEIVNSWTRRLLDIPFLEKESEITHPDTQAIARVFDLAYHAQMFLLIRFFGQTDKGESESEALALAAFFPLMTALIRPLGETLTQLKAKNDGSPYTAGAYFEIPRSLALLPHSEPAWQVLHYQLGQIGENLQELLKDKEFPESVDDEDTHKELRERLELTSLDALRIASDFKRNMGLEDDK